MYMKSIVFGKLHRFKCRQRILANKQMPAARFQIMQPARFRQPHDFAGGVTGKKNRVVERDEFAFGAALFAKKLKADAAAQNKKFVAARDGGNFLGAFCHLG